MEVQLISVRDCIPIKLLVVLEYTWQNHAISETFRTTTGTTSKTTTATTTRSDTIIMCKQPKQRRTETLNTHPVLIEHQKI